MKASTKRILSILTSALLLIGGLVVYSNFIRPAYNDIIKLRGEVAARGQILEDQDNAIKQVQELIRQFESVSQLQERISLALPFEHNVPQVLVQLESLGRRTGVEVESISLNYLALDPPLKKGDISSLIKGIGKIRFGLKIKGEYEGIKNYIKGLAQSIRLFDIASLHLTGTGTGQTFHSANLELDGYYQTK